MYFFGEGGRPSTVPPILRPLVLMSLDEYQEFATSLIKCQYCTTPGSHGFKSGQNITKVLLYGVEASSVFILATILNAIVFLDRVNKLL